MTPADPLMALAATALRNVRDGVIATDASGCVIFMNEVAASLVEQSFDEARGKPIADVWRAESDDAGGATENPVLSILSVRGSASASGERTVVRSDGRRMPVEFSVSPVRDSSEELVGIAVVFRDLTAERRGAGRRAFLLDSGEALASSIDYRDALGAVVELAVPRFADICTIDILDVGKERAERLAAAHRDPAKLEVLREVGRRYPVDPKLDRGIPNVIRTGIGEIFRRIPLEALLAYAVDDEHRRLLDILRFRSCMVVPLRGRDRVFGAVTFMHAESGREYDDEDLAFAELLGRRAALVIERRKLEEEREHLLEREQRARREAEVANLAKDEFLATVSHELRNPLSAILGWADLLLRRELPEDVRRNVETIERNAQAQARLIDDILDFARILTGKLRLHIRSANVEQAASDALEAVRPLIDEKRIHVVMRVEAGLEMQADQVRLQQIFVNLLSNAVKFTPRDGGVLLSAERKGPLVEIALRDSGEGIDPELLESIFEPFHQADASTTRTHGGLGLGLAIVRRLVAAHGGTVRAESEGKGRGAAFVVGLPWIAVEQRDEVATLVQRPPIARRLEGVRVLVVDDQPDAVGLAREVLMLAGATVETASSATAALDALRRDPPDVLVTDIGMPDVDGYTLARNVRALGDAQGGNTPAIALTAYTQEEDVARALAAGFQRQLTKPIRADELVDAVASLSLRGR